MPEVRYVGGATYALRDGPTWADGDVYEVAPETADRLCDDWRFERVKSDGDEESDEEPPEDDGEDFEAQVASVSELIDDGRCPWCSDYSGDAVGRHASAAHPDEWGDHKAQRE